MNGGKTDAQNHVDNDLVRQFNNTDIFS